MKLGIKYSLEFEVKRVADCLQRIKNYEKMGYGDLHLPQGIDVNNFSEEQVKKMVLSEYDEKKYEMAKKRLENLWNEVEEDIEARLKDLKLSACLIYQIKLTRYGTLGSYKLPNIIVLNIETKRDFVSVIVHEMVHIMLEKLFNEYALEYIEKEILIDLICAEILAGKYIKQRVYEKNKNEAERINVIFSKYFPNIKGIVRKIEGSHQIFHLPE